jgi:hypothetical protein
MIKSWQIPQLDEVSGWVNYTWWIFQQAMFNRGYTAGHVRQKSETSRNPAALKQQSPSNWGFPKKRDAPVSIHIKTCQLNWGLLWLRKASSLNFPTLSHQHPSTSLKCPRTIVHLGLIHSLLCSTSEFLALEFCEVQALLPSLIQ